MEPGVLAEGCGGDGLECIAGPRVDDVRGDLVAVDVDVEAAELSRGPVQEVIVRGEQGYAVVISAGRGALLLAVTNETSKLGLVFFDMREAIRALQNVL